MRLYARRGACSKTDGDLHVAAWGRPANRARRVAFVAVQLLDGFETTAHHVAGHLSALIARAGFAAVREMGSLSAEAGILRLYRAAK